MPLPGAVEWVGLAAARQGWKCGMPLLGAALALKALPIEGLGLRFTRRAIAIGIATLAYDLLTGPDPATGAPSVCMLFAPEGRAGSACRTWAGSAEFHPLAMLLLFAFVGRPLLLLEGGLLFIPVTGLGITQVAGVVKKPPRPEDVVSWLESAAGGARVRLEDESAPVAFLTIVCLMYLLELWFLVYTDGARVRSGQRARDLHEYITERQTQVRELVSSAAWGAHFRKHPRSDALWRHRRRPLGRRVLKSGAFVGVSALALAWWASRQDVPDVLLATSFLTALACGGLAHLAYRMLTSGCRGAWRLCRRRCEMDAWVEERNLMEDSDIEDERCDSVDWAPEPKYLFLPEDADELAQRRAIEAMRIGRRCACAVL